MCVCGWVKCGVSVPCVNLEHMVAGNENIGIGDCWLTLRSPHVSRIPWATPRLIGPICRGDFTRGWARMR